MKTTNINKFGRVQKEKSLLIGDCIFPFIYKGKKHTVCVNGKTGNWCATTLKKSGCADTWAYCINDEKDKSEDLIIEEIQPNVEHFETPDQKERSKKLKLRLKRLEYQIETTLSHLTFEYIESKPIMKKVGVVSEQFENIQKHFFLRFFLSKTKKWCVSLFEYHNEDKRFNKNKYFPNIEDAFEYYVLTRETMSKHYNIVNFEGLDDNMIKEYQYNIQFEPVDVSTCKYDKSMLDDDIYLKDLPNNKIIKVNSQNCYDIDELVQYLISSNGKNIDPMDIIEGLTTPIWKTEKELLFIRNFPTIPKDKKTEFQTIIDYQINIMRKPPYLDIMNTNEGYTFLYKLITTGKICTEDYTNDFKPSQIEITKTREYLYANFSKEDIDKIKIISTTNGKTIEDILIKNTSSTCIHGIGFSLISLYFSGFIKIRDNIELLQSPLKIQLFPGIIEVSKNVFMFCHSNSSSHKKINDLLYPLTVIYFDIQNTVRGQNSGGAGRILTIYNKSKILPESLWGFSILFSKSKIPLVIQHYTELTNVNSKNILMQFYDTPQTEQIKTEVNVVLKSCSSQISSISKNTSKNSSSSKSITLKSSTKSNSLKSSTKSSSSKSRTLKSSTKSSSSKSRTLKKSPIYDSFDSEKTETIDSK